MNNVIKAVLAQSNLSAQEFCDVANHGADGGWNGFIYYTETEAFYDKNESLINEELENTKDSCYGDETTMVQMLKGFGRGGDLSIVKADFAYNAEEDTLDFDEYVFDVDVVWESINDECEMEAVAKDTAYKNLMAWFLLEEAARMVQQHVEDEEWEELEAMGVDCSEVKEEA